MELHQLRYFVAVAETHSFTRAAERCFVAQPSLSQQIQKLERSLKKPLFDRLGKTIRLTEAGEALLPRARQILAALNATEQALRADDQPGEGRLRLGAIPTVGPYWLPPRLTRLLRRFPHIEMHLREDVTANLLAALHAGELDVAFAALPIADPHLVTKPIHREPLLLALPTRHRLQRQKAIARADLEAEPFLLLGEMHCLTDQVTAYCEAKFVPRVTCRCVQLSTIQQMVKLGLGISLVPQMACKKESGITYRELQSPAPSRTLAAVWHPQHYLGPNAQALLESL